MKLKTLCSKPSARKLNKIVESRFGFAIDYDKITYPKAVAMSNKIMETVNNIRHSSAIHTAEKDSKYLEMLIVYEGLQRWIDAYSVQRSQKIFESEMGQAEAILAAKDMVDTCQDMIEKVGKMQNEQLPALIDTIRDQIGSEQADAYKGSVGQVLATLSAQLNQTREQLDNAARGLTGENPTLDAGGPPAPDQPGQPGEEGATDEFSTMDAAAGGTETLGREARQ